MQIQHVQLDITNRSKRWYLFTLFFPAAELIFFNPGNVVILVALSQHAVAAYMEPHIYM